MQYTIKPSEAISSQAATIIRTMIVEGEISDGERINEVHLSKHLNISRTPIREGLGQLVAEQFVESIPRRGFFAREMTAYEFSNLYDLRPILDVEAFILGGQPSTSEIDTIEVANQRFHEAAPGNAAVNADDAFHKLLLARCPNKVLMEFIDSLILRTRRYELALFRETTPIKSADNQHALIIKALRDRDMVIAAKRLRGNLTSGKAPIIKWLSTRQV